MPTALVTGASAGIGRAFSLELARRGYDVILVSRTQSSLEALAVEMSAAGVRGEVLPADVSKDSDCQILMDRLADQARPVDILVNNAGFGLNQPFVGGSLADEELLLDVLCRAVLRLTHAALPAMLERGTGHVINVSSVAGWTPISTYAAAKAWTTVFTEALSTQLRGTGVTATAVCPGFTRTEFHGRADIDVSLPGWAWLDAATVARQGLDHALSGATISIPSKRYTVLSWGLQALPRPVLRRAAASPMNPRRVRHRDTPREGPGQ